MEVTLGHSLASARADAVVTRRQLLPPNPSVNPSLIFFGPHHDGTAVVLADDAAAVTSRPMLRSAHASSAPPRLGVILDPPSSVIGKSGENATSGRRDGRGPTPCDTPGQCSPVDCVKSNTRSKCGRLNKRAGGIRHPERENELIELRQEKGGEGRRNDVAATAEKRRAAEHDRRDGRQKVVVAFIGRWLVDDSRMQNRCEAIEELRPEV